MAKIILKNGGEINPDIYELIDFNAQIKANEVAAFEVTYYDRKVYVDLENKKIYIDDELVKEETRDLENIRFINFRRIRETRTMDGTNSKKQLLSYGVGFQGTLDGENIKHFYLIRPTGEIVEA